jgi:hypothetical protein
MSTEILLERVEALAVAVKKLEEQNARLLEYIKTDDKLKNQMIEFFKSQNPQPEDDDDWRHCRSGGCM